MTTLEKWEQRIIALLTERGPMSRRDISEAIGASATGGHPASTTITAMLRAGKLEIAVKGKKGRGSSPDIFRIGDYVPPIEDDEGEPGYLPVYDTPPRVCSHCGGDWFLNTSDGPECLKCGTIHLLPPRVRENRPIDPKKEGGHRYCALCGTEITYRRAAGETRCQRCVDAEGDTVADLRPILTAMHDQLMSAERAAKVAGVSPTTMHRWLRGVRTPGRKCVEQVCNALHVPVEVVYRREAQ